MSNVVIPYRFRVKRDTAANFTAANTLLLEGEFGLETDTGRLKIGDGSTAWTSLLYCVPGQIDLSALSDGDVLAWDATNGKFVAVAQGGGGSTWTTVPKTANETRSLTATLADDAELTASLFAGTKYIMRVKVYFLTANAVMDYKIAPAYSGTITGTPVHHRGFTNQGAAASFDTVWEGVIGAVINQQTNTAVSTSGYAIYESEIIFETNASGTFSIQWAQNTSDAGNLSVLAGSYLEYMAL